MQKRVMLLIILLGAIFLVQGISSLLAARSAFDAGFGGAAWFALFIGFVHFYISFGLLKKKKWAPHLGIFFQAYLLLNFFIGNFRTIFSTELLPSVVTVLSLTALITCALFFLRNKFKE